MQKLINYINNIGIPADSYQLEKVGSKYFLNISIQFDRATVIFDYTTYDARELDQHEKQLEKYCNRFNYTIYNRGSVPGLRYFSIMPKENREALENYFIFENNSREDCEKIINHYTRTGRRSSHPAELEKALKDIMQQHENNYKSYLRAIAS